MDDLALVLVHSPLVGPLTWRAVGDELAAAGWTVAVPELTAAMAGAGPYLPRIAAAVAAAADPVGRPVVLVGHSGAGPLLPALAAALAVPVSALIYVDAGLPYPGRTWLEEAPADLVAHLRGLARDGWLPPWHEWFPAEAVAGLLPEPELRARFTAPLAPLPLAYFEERMPARDWSGPAGYLRLSDAYTDDAARAAERGLPVRELPSDHLAMLTAPAAVAAALRDLLAAVRG